MKTGKTPYEIRLELIQVARDILMAKHGIASNVSAKHDDVGAGFPKTSPTTEEIIAEAEKMNIFISNGNSTQ